MRKVVATVVACFSFASWALSADSQASIRHATHIPEQALDTALQLLAKDRNLQMIYPYGVVGERRTRGAHGELTFDEAIKQLLVGTELTYRFLDERTVTIEPAAGVPAVSGATGSPATATSSLVQPQEESGSWLKLAQASNEERESQEKDGSESSSIQDRGLQEIVVTAQKRTEKLRDVPMSIGVQTAKDLDKFHPLEFSDYAGYIAGLTVKNADGQPGHNQVILRGISTLAGVSPLVSTYLDDAPLAFVVGAQFGEPDVNPYDIERVEVLRGPQGTLWGANSISGMIRYVTAQPDLHHFSARTGVELISVSQSNQLGHAARGAVNLPLADDRIALRASVSHTYNPGYVDNRYTGKRDENAADFYVANAALLWQATDVLSLQLKSRVQRTDSHGRSLVDFNVAQDAEGQPARGGLVDGTLSTDHALAEFQRLDLRRLEFDLTWNLGLADLTAISAYSQEKTTLVRDYTDGWRDSILPLIGVIDGFTSVKGGPYAGRKFVEEIRLTSRENAHLDWITGVYYNDEHNVPQARAVAYDSQLNLVNSSFVSWKDTYDYREWAAYGDVTYKLTPQFDLTAGVRWGQNTQDVIQNYEVGAFYDVCCGGGQPTPVSYPSSRDSSVTYATSARYHFNEDGMFYARIATGFRPGGPNLLTEVDRINVPQAPDAYDPDKDINYELGLKASFFDYRLQLDASVFRIEMSDIQSVSVFTSPSGDYQVDALVNAGRARSDGVELATMLAPVKAFQVTMTLGYVKPVFLTDQPVFNLHKGDLIPGAAQWTGSVSAGYNRPLSSGWRFDVGAGVRYQGKRKDYLDVPGYSPANTLTDCNTSLVNDHWKVNLYVRNLFDKLVYSYDMGLQNGYYGNRFIASVNQPRTLGLSVDRSF